jgi:hypothetical protein
LPAAAPLRRVARGAADFRACAVALTLAAWRTNAGNIGVLSLVLTVIFLVWAGLIVALTAIGFATLYLGLIVTAPLPGHATCHAYRDIVT